MITVSIILDILYLVGIVGASIFIVFYLDWRVDRRKSSPRISFELFKEMYQLNPDIWSLDSSDYLIFNKSIYSHQRVEFNSYKDVLKYNNFRKKQRKDKFKQERYEAEVELVKELQKEIDKYQKENIEEIKRSIEEYETN